jgi:hypothetical protein
MVTKFCCAIALAENSSAADKAAICAPWRAVRACFIWFSLGTLRAVAAVRCFSVKARRCMLRLLRFINQGKCLLQ